MIIGNPKIRRRMNSVIDNICILGFFILLPFAIIAGICSGLISKVINKWLNRRRSLKKCMACFFDEKMKLLVALKDNPNESLAIIDTMTYQEKVKMTEPRSRDLIVLAAALRCSRRSPQYGPLQPYIKGVVSTSVTLRIVWPSEMISNSSVRYTSTSKTLSPSPKVLSIDTTASSVTTEKNS